MKVLLEEMTREAAHAAFEQNAMVVLPTGSIEQHGAHLPLLVDTTIVTHIARTAAEQAATRAPILVAPTVHYGVSHHHLAFAGTMSLTSRIYVDAVKELIRCLYGHGVRQLVIVNGHGGNVSPNSVAANALVHEEGLEMAIGSVSYWSLPVSLAGPDGAREQITLSPGHAGTFETSLMLALRPDLVQLEARRAPLAALSSIAHASEYGAFARAGGTTDDASGASAAEGRQLLPALVEALIEYLVQFYERTRRSHT